MAVQNPPRDDRWLQRRLAELERRLRVLETTPRSDVLFVAKALDEPLSANTVVQNDDALVLPVVASANFELSGLLIFNGGAANDDLKTGWTAPAGSTLDWMATAQPIAATTTSGTVVTNSKTLADLSSLGTIGTGTNLTALITGRLTTGATAGSLQFQWAQVTSSATATTVCAGSYIALRRVA